MVGQVCVCVCVCVWGGGGGGGLGAGVCGEVGCRGVWGGWVQQCVGGRGGLLNGLVNG